ncbi:hypothetical protein BD626DRAFT_478988 [Schizophyllum amplum]|uniref:Uncharacterized protein n=1 Tax=Schizophyllum amplum TaxID=97359 RepID=A0A550CRU0_9AGAR|nr:hypothetical protein BD626DRAFT_478988 [Auriculariopsis ampla]
MHPGFPPSFFSEDIPSTSPPYIPTTGNNFGSHRPPYYPSSGTYPHHQMTMSPSDPCHMDTSPMYSLAAVSSSTSSSHAILDTPYSTQQDGFGYGGAGESPLYGSFSPMDGIGVLRPFNTLYPPNSHYPGWGAGWDFPPPHAEALTPPVTGVPSFMNGEDF